MAIDALGGHCSRGRECPKRTRPNPDLVIFISALKGVGARKGSSAENARTLRGFTLWVS
jgi:hypothetical protein